MKQYTSAPRELIDQFKSTIQNKGTFRIRWIEDYIEEVCISDNRITVVFDRNKSQITLYGTDISERNYIAIFDELGQAKHRKWANSSCPMQ